MQKILELTFWVELIANVKKVSVFIKDPLRMLENLPVTSLPSEPIVSRWSTWIRAAMFYAKNYQKLKEHRNAYKNFKIPKWNN